MWENFDFVIFFEKWKKMAPIKTIWQLLNLNQNNALEEMFEEVPSNIPSDQMTTIILKEIQMFFVESFCLWKINITVVTKLVINISAKESEIIFILYHHLKRCSVVDLAVDGDGAVVVVDDGFDDG